MKFSEPHHRHLPALGDQQPAAGADVVQVAVEPLVRAEVAAVAGEVGGAVARDLREGAGMVAVAFHRGAWIVVFLWCL